MFVGNFVTPAAASSFAAFSGTTTGTGSAYAGRLLAFAGKPGRSLCQYVALLLDLAQSPAQAHQVFAFRRRQAFFAGQRLAAIAAVLDDPVGDALCRGAELTRELRGRLAGACQLDDLLAKFRRVRRL